MEKRPSLVSRLKSPHLLLVLILFAYLLVGIATIQDFGESIDEDYAYNYAKNSLAAYIGQGKHLRNDQGSVYIMVARLGSDFLSKIHPQWLPVESWHLMHFLSFLMGLGFLYIICLKINAPGPGRGGSTIPKPVTSRQWGRSGRCSCSQSSRSSGDTPLSTIKMCLLWFLFLVALPLDW
jgi:hypothetical protein